MRLIDGDVLMAWFNDHYDDEQVSVGFVSGLIKDAPTIDAVEVVRCKECKWSYRYEIPNGEYRCCCMEHGSSGHMDDDYCSYGEKVKP